MANPVVKIAPNNPVFDLPVLVGIEDGLFAKAGLDVSLSASYADRERDTPESKILARLKEEQFECGSADSYNVCEWASIDRLDAARAAASSRRSGRRSRPRPSSPLTRRCRCRATWRTCRSWCRS